MRQNFVVHTWASSAAHLLPILLDSPTSSLSRHQGGEREGQEGGADDGGTELNKRTPLACALARSAAQPSADGNQKAEAAGLEDQERCRVLRPAPATQSDFDLNPVAWSVCVCARVACRTTQRVACVAPSAPLA